MKYLMDGLVVMASASKVKDVITGVELNAQSDGDYVWDSSCTYGFEKYNVKLPDEFINQVIGKLQKG